MEERVGENERKIERELKKEWGRIEERVSENERKSGGEWKKE